MKKLLAICVSSVLLVSLSGCSLGSVIDQFRSSDSEELQDINPDSIRVYMDEIRGTLQDFTGSQITISTATDTYTFDISQATLECANGMVSGDAVSVVYEGQLDSTDTSTVKALKVVDDYHQTTVLEEKTTHGQVQSLTANTITIKSKGGKVVMFPVTGTKQYYQAGIKAGTWVYLHYKGAFPVNADGTQNYDGTHMKILSVSDIDPITLPAPTPTPVPQEGVEVKPENKMRAVIQNVQTNVLQVTVENTANVLNIDMSAIPCYFSGGIAPGSHASITYTGDFNGTTLEGITVLGITGDVPENTSQRNTTFTVSGDIVASTANTITLRTYDGINVTCDTETASNESSGGLLAGSSVKVTFNPADSRQTNIYTALKIEDP